MRGGITVDNTFPEKYMYMQPHSINKNGKYGIAYNSTRNNIILR